MEQELKDKWIKALRSGRYKQTQKTLREIDDKGKTVGYCCLGVLCAVSRKGKFTNDGERVSINSSVTKSATSKFWVAKKYGDNLDIVKNHDLEGIEDLFGLYTDDTEKLMGMNDSDGKNFEQIAEWIEQNL